MTLTPRSRIASPVNSRSPAFHFEAIEPGEYRLSASRPGCVNKEYGSRTRQGFGSGATLKLEKAQKLPQLDIKLIPHAVITGRIVDEDGDPVPYADVQLLRFRYSQGSRQLTPFAGASTNDLGEYRMVGVAPGKYYLSFMNRNNGGYGANVRTDPAGGEDTYSATYFPIVSDPASAVQFEVAQGARVQGMDVKLLRARTYRVSGQLVVPGGGPRPPVTVVLSKRNPSDFIDRGLNTVRSPDGKFVIRGVQPGAYAVVAMYYTPDARLTARAVVDVTNANVDVGTMTVAPGPEITGTIRGESETPPPVEGMMVYLRTDTGQMVFGQSTATVKSDGSFSIKNGPRTKVSVSAMRLPDGYYLKTARFGDIDALVDGVDLGGLDSTALDLVLSHKAAQVQGHVIDAKGNPAKAATVVLIPAAEDKRKRQELWAPVQTDQTGGYSLKNRPPGEYYLLASMDLEPGEETDPEFLKKFDAKVEKFELKESAIETKQLKLPEPR